MMLEIQCTNCKIQKSIDSFYRRKDKEGNGLFLTCKDCKNKKRKDWRTNNPEKVKEGYQKKYLREKQDNSFRIKKNVSRRVRFILKSKKDNHSFFNYVSYSFQELKQHIESKFESWMSWKNHGNYNPKTWDDQDPSTWTWQLDHIIPHSCFKYSSMKDESFKQCWALKNLRPLASKQNIIDGAYRKRHV